jgi:hypothetical protein
MIMIRPAGAFGDDTPPSIAKSSQEYRTKKTNIPTIGTIDSFIQKSWRELRYNLKKDPLSRRIVIFISSSPRSSCSVAFNLGLTLRLLTTNKHLTILSVVVTLDNDVNMPRPQEMHSRLHRRKECKR